MEYSKCSNGSCVHNDEYLCKAGGLGEDIVCKQSKADAIRKVRNQREGPYLQIYAFKKNPRPALSFKTKDK